MNTSFEYKKLKKLTTKIGSGATPKGGKESYKNEGISLIRSLNVYDYRFSYKDLALIDEKQADRLKNVEVKKDDILLNITGASVCRCTIVPVDLLPARVNQHVSIIRANERVLNPKFALYAINSASLKQGLFNLAMTGATREALTKSDIENFHLPVPKISIQKKIAAILSSYDELIENNQRRITLLEKMAEEIYREWFVRFRFPGYQSAEFAKGIPKGWETDCIKNHFKTFLGGTPSRDNPRYWGGEIPWINSGEVNKSRITRESEFITEEGLNQSATKLMPKRTTLLAITGATLGQVSLTEIEVCANQSVVGIYDKKEIYNLYLFEYMKTNIENLISKQSGGGQQHINKDIIEKENILLPPKQLVIDFNHKVESIYDSISSLIFSNLKLDEIKNKLLPRLISGKLSVDNLDIQFPPSMCEECTA